MKGIERFIELCMEQWPDTPLGFKIYPYVTGGYRLQVTVDRWLTPCDFSEHDLTQPHAMIHTLKMTMNNWSPLYPKEAQ